MFKAKSTGDLKINNRKMTNASKLLCVYYCKVSLQSSVKREGKAVAWFIWGAT
jgi:hypothetical protein